MQNVMDPLALFKEINSAGLRRVTSQWGSLASLAQYRKAYEITLKYLRRPSKALDWGCGKGHFSYFLTSQGVQTVGYCYEERPAFLDSNPLFSFVPARTADPVSLPFESDSLDEVFSVGVLEHVHETGGRQKASVQEIDRILKKDGLFLVFHLPNKYTWIEFVIRHLNRLAGTKFHSHSKLFTLKDFQALLEGTSLEILEYGRYNFVPRNMLSKLPERIGKSTMVAKTIDVIDTLGNRLLPFFCQNWYFVLRKRA